MCKFESTYYSNIYTENEIRNAYQITSNSSREINRFNFTVVLNPYHLKFISFEKLDKEYNTKRDKIDSMALPKTPIYEAYRTSILKEMDQLYAMFRTVYESYINDDPKAFGRFHASDSCMIKHSKALNNGGEALLEGWKELISIKIVEGNTSLKERYERRLKSPDKFLYAQIHVTAFGWWNCANKYVDRFDDHQAFKEFQKLLISSKILICDGD